MVKKKNSSENVSSIALIERKDSLLEGRGNRGAREQRAEKKIKGILRPLLVAAKGGGLSLDKQGKKFLGRGNSGGKKKLRNELA